MKISDPGPELDALVAEKVMGWHRSGDDLWAQWLKEDGSETWYYVQAPTLDTACRDWEPSRDIRAAWEVVLAVWDRGLGWMLVAPNHDGSKWEAYQATSCADPDFGDWCVPNGQTAPHAICLAALKAVGYDP